jgi:hypothetical protein
MSANVMLCSIHAAAVDAPELLMLDVFYSTRFPSTSMVMLDVALRAGSQFSGFLFKNGHGGTIATKVRAVPARPTYRVSRMSCAM